MTVTYWRKTVTYINSLEIGEIFTRVELFENVYREELSNFKRLRRFENAVDHYRKYLCILQFIERYSLGKYKKLEQIPLMLTSSIAERLSYGKDWKDWFIPNLQERIEAELNAEKSRTKTRRKVS
jgi:hypothetical protein